MQSAKNNWEGRCSAARPPHKKVREGMRDANPLPLGRSLDLPTRSRAALQRPSQLTPRILIYPYNPTISVSPAFVRGNAEAYRIPAFATPERPILGPM